MCKSSKYSIEKMEQDELKAAKKIQTPVVYNQAKTPSSLLAKTKTAASSFLNKFSSNQPTTPSSIKSKIPESVKSASTTKPMIKTGFSTPTTARPIVSKTPSTVHTFQTKARFNNINEKRLVNSVTKPTINTYKTPSKTDTNANINLRKNISRTVDCAKTAIRRSIRRLNSPPSKLAQTPNLQKKTPYLASSKIPTVKRDLCKTEGNQRTVNLTRNVNTELRSIKRQSLMARRSSLGLNEDSLIFVTPRQIRRLFESASKVNQDNKIEEEEEIKIQSVKPSSLLKYLIKDRHAEKIKNIQENIIEEVLQPECVNTISEENISKIDSVSNDNNTKQENIIINNISISEEPKVAKTIEAVQIEENLNLQNIETKESESKTIEEKFQTQEPVMKVEADQMVNTIIHVKQVQKEDIKVSSENESIQTREPVMEVEQDQKVTTIESIQFKDEYIKINAENESTQTEEPVMEIEQDQKVTTIESIQLKDKDIKVSSENESIQTREPVMEIEQDQKVTTIESIQFKDEDIKVNAEDESSQTEEPVMEVKANQMVNTIHIIQAIEGQKDDIKIISENESTQIEEPVMEVESNQIENTIDNIQSLELQKEDIKINAEDESSQTEEPVMEVKANQMVNTIDIIQTIEGQKDDIKINPENENYLNITAEKIEVTETIQTNESDELKITEVVKNIELQNTELDNGKIQSVENTPSEVNQALTEKSEDDLKTIPTDNLIEEEIKIGMLNEIETNIDIPIEKATYQSESNSSISNQENNTENKESDLGAVGSQVNVDSNKIEENYQEELIQSDVVESVHDEKLKENVNISIENEQMNFQINQKIENSLTDGNSNNEETNLIGSVPIEQATENANISRSEEQSNIEECNQDIEISIATNAETQCSFIDEIPNNEEKQEMNFIESEQVEKKEKEPEEQNKIDEDIKSITITPETIQEPELKIDPVPTAKETKVSNTKRKRKQPLDEINHDIESKEAVLSVVEPSEEETGVKKRKYTRKNNKTEIQPEIIEKKVDEVEPQVVEEQTKPKRTYKKRAAAAPVEQEPSSKFQKENTEPIENERVLTRAQRAKLNQK